ncbi:NUC173-domain-containing protein [Neoconidiobolus thromboides FSU 785]|nr:NUC173-domain-containing protein [Neoconidiobolus thromboides FSU 785]
MEETLIRIRSQINSKLNNQKQIAVTLQVVEETLEASKQEKIPSAYLALLLTLLEQDDGKNRPSILYLLNVVISEVPENVLRAKFPEVSKILLLVIDEDREVAPTMKSVLGCFEIVFKVQTQTNWSQPLVQRSFQALLSFCIDQRPKVRRKAHEVVALILKDAPTIASTITSEYCIETLRKFRKVSNNSVSNEVAPFLMFIKSIADKWSSENLIKLNEQLIAFPKLNNAFVTTLVYEIFTEIIIHIDVTNLDAIMKKLLLSKPNSNEIKSMIAWLISISTGFSEIIKNNPDQFFVIIPTISQTLFKEFEETSIQVVTQTGKSISNLIKSYPFNENEFLSSEKLDIVQNLFEFVQGALSYRFRNSWGSILTILESLYSVFGRNHPELLTSSLRILDSMRNEDNFEFKIELQNTIGAAIYKMGPKRFLSILPLNLENPGQKTVGRGWLVPLLKEHIANADFTFFTNEFLNLADRLENKANEFEQNGRSIEAKVYQTLSHQIWSLFPSFAIYPQDLQAGFSSGFATKVADKIQNCAELQPALLNGLALIIEYNRRLIPENEVLDVEEINKLLNENQLDAATCQQNLIHIAQFATDYLMLFFNLYPNVPQNIRGLLLKVILTFLNITPNEQINATFVKIVSMINDESNSNPNKTEQEAQNEIMMLDFASIMTPYLTYDNSKVLFNLGVQRISNASKGGIQKRAYKILNKMLFEPTTSYPYTVACEGLADIENEIIESGLNIGSAAIKERLNFLKIYIDILPNTHLHIISSLTSEAILGTKEINEKSREASYDLLIIMANKMIKGGIIDATKLNGGRTGIVEANLREYIMMVIAGLTGTTSHMISATISALSRIIFEFHNQIEDELIYQLIQTMEMFVSNTNREIVKSALGFVKVISVSLDVVSLKPHLEMLIKSILKWSNDNSNRFKVKVRHIIERLIRRFGLELVQQSFPDEHMKLINNIRKRKLRAKRRGKTTTEEDVEDQPINKPTLGNAFEDALYGSESELEDDDEDKAPAASSGLKRKMKSSDAYIKDDNLGDTPIDFLDRKAISRITTNKPTNRPLEARKALTSAFKTDKSGRLVIADEGDSENEGENKADPKDNPNSIRVNNDYYKESLESKEGFERVNNRIKFKKQRGRGQEEIEIEEGGAQDNRKKNYDNNNSNRNKKMAGTEYKAKHAQGDVKKKGKLDPFAYIPLNPKMVPSKGKKAEKVKILKRD